MLILTRRINETIMIGGEITVTVLGVKGNQVRIGIDAPDDVRIVRDESLMSPSLPGLYPIGEGAGYAGGIVSAAIDGLRTADALIARLGAS